MYKNINIDELYKLRVDSRWTYEELAELYYVSVKTAINRCKENNFPAIKVNRSYSKKNKYWGDLGMANKSLRNYINLCKKHGIKPTLKGMKLWSKICK